MAISFFSSFLLKSIEKRKMSEKKIRKATRKTPALKHLENGRRTYFQRKRNPCR